LISPFPIKLCLMSHRLRWAVLALVAAGASLTGVSPTQDAVASGATRSLTIFHAHTKEQETITFKESGSFSSAGLQKLNWLLRDWRADEPIRMDPNLFDLLWEVYRASGSSGPIHVVSAYRSPGTNAMLRRRSSGVARHSMHMTGQAMDFNLPDVSMAKVRDIGLRMQSGGVGYYPRANNPWVHLDTGGVRHWPKVPRDHLVRLFPDEKTVHIPRDGKPLAGFELARASIEARGGSVSSGYIDIAEGRATGKSLFQILFGGGEEEEDVAPRGRGRTAVAARGRRPADRQQVAAVASDPTEGSAVSFFNQNTTTTYAAQTPASQASIRVAAAPPSRPTPLPEAKEEPRNGESRNGESRREETKTDEARSVELAALAPRAAPTSTRADESATTGRNVTVPLPLRRPAGLGAQPSGPVLVNVPLPLQRPASLLAATSGPRETDEPVLTASAGRLVNVPLPLARAATTASAASIGLRTAPMPATSSALGFAPPQANPANPLASGPGNAFDKRGLNSLVANVSTASATATASRVAPASVTSLVNPQGVTGRFGDASAPPQTSGFSGSAIRPIGTGFRSTP
jgi:uncharacterized protein YcbK (DUF882 family)